MQLAKENETARMKKIQRKIAVVSGKGGVGKTTIAAGVAAALSRDSRVGFLDADIDCPNAHILFGIDGNAEMENGILKPMLIDVPSERQGASGIKFMSMSMLAGEGEAIMWRGPMLTKALNDMLLRTDWGELDYLIIDMPPGSSDAALTVMQSLSDAEFLVVTTAGEMAKADAERVQSMLRKMGRKIVVAVENMCSDIFGCTHDVKLTHVPLSKEIAGKGAFETADNLAVAKICEAVRKA